MSASRRARGAPPRDGGSPAPALAGAPAGTPAAEPTASGKTGLTCVTEADTALVRLSGTIGEGFELSVPPAQAYVIDLDQVPRITSHGVTRWRHALAKLDAEYHCFVRARPTLVAQFNMLEDFAGRGELVTFYAPYRCPPCGKEFDILLDRRRQQEQIAAFTPPVARCPVCQRALEIDEVPESYLAYAAAAPPPSPPRAVEHLLSWTIAAPFRVDKEVTQELTAVWCYGALDGRIRFARLLDGLEGQVVAILAGVTEARSEALASLFQAADDSGFRLVLARVPGAVLSSIQAVPKGAPPVVSLELPYRCTRCQADQAREIPAGAVHSLDAVMPLPCEHCGGALSFAAAPAVIEAARRLTPAPSAPAVADYLAHHRVSPRQRALAEPPPAPPAPEKPVAGEVLFGRYRILRLLGTGGMAEIFLARQVEPPGFERMVALKRILPHLSRSASFIQMLLQEARLAARLSHPNVVQVYEVGKVDDRHYIAMEYVQGWDLATILRLTAVMKVRIPVELVFLLVRDVCAGLGAAHQHLDEEGRRAPIVHRDISPQNILLSRGGFAKLTDFGVAKAADSLVNTENGRLKGKIAYAAPERFATDGDPSDPRSDIFGVGVVLDECLTGRRLFLRETETATMKAVLEEPIVPVSKRRSDVPPVTDAILARALARRPEERYQTVQELQLDLEQLLALVEPATSLRLAAWLRDLVERSIAAGKLPRTRDDEVVSGGPDGGEPTIPGG